MTDHSETTGEREYTREEMREACRNNYDAGRQAMAGPVIEDWKERNLRRVDIGGMSVMVLREDAMRHLEGVRQKMAQMQMALHHVVHLIEEDKPLTAMEAAMNAMEEQNG